VNSDSKLTPMKTKMCGAKESNNQYQSKTQATTTITLRSNQGIKVKSSKPQAKDKERRETNTPRNVYLVQSNLTYSGGEIDLSNPLSMSSYKEIQMGYKKLASTNSQRTNLISTHFPDLTKEQDTQWFSLTQDVYKCFPTKRTLIKDPQP